MPWLEAQRELWGHTGDTVVDLNFLTYRLAISISMMWPSLLRLFRAIDLMMTLEVYIASTITWISMA